MSEIETNIFRITNLRDLSSSYRTYKIINLHRDQEDYYQNRQHVIQKLSFRLRSPVEVIEENGEAVLIVKDDAPEPPKELPVVRTTIGFEALEKKLDLNYATRSPQNDAICIRFLSFLVQKPLRDNPNFWQPGAGQAFYGRLPAAQGQNLNLYRGFSVRPILTPLGDIGLCVDATSKLVSKRPLPIRMDRQLFRQFKGAHCIYHFGKQWYEIRLTDFCGFDVSHHRFELESRENVFLYNYILDLCEKPLPSEIANLPKDSAVIFYNDKREQKRSAPVALCFRVVGNDDSTAQKEFPSLSLPPETRRELVQGFVRSNLQRLRFGDSEMKVDARPLTTPSKMFRVPDLMFGCSKVLSTRATPGAVQVSVDALGSKRLSLLKDHSAGFYESSPLDNFLFFIPQSVADTFGSAIVDSLCASTDDLFPQERAFSPQIIPYPDRNVSTFSQACDALFSTAATAAKRGGYAVIMLHEAGNRRIRQEDTTAAHVIQKFRERFDLRASVIHSTVGQNCYRAFTNGDGKTIYRARDQRAERRLNGYFRNVAINKILLLNQKWPFVLATPLNADAIVGIDVKGNMAGFIATNKRGNIIIPFHQKSQQKEKLMPKQCRDYFCEVMTKLISLGGGEPVTNIAVHRDGKLYDTEIKGIQMGLEKLKSENHVPQNAQITHLEIPKTAPVPLRLFDLSITDEEPNIQNPQVGNYYVLNENEGFVCTTGRAFRHQGTTKPLHVIKRSGPMKIEDGMDDVFALSCLAWTRPEDCSRDPVTIKLNDRWLGEDGTEHKEEEESETEDNITIEASK